MKKDAILKRRMLTIEFYDETTIIRVIRAMNDWGRQQYVKGYDDGYSEAMKMAIKAQDSIINDNKARKTKPFKS